jgi:hypothetical protein
MLLIFIICAYQIKKISEALVLVVLIIRSSIYNFPANVAVAGTATTDYCLPATASATVGF